MNQRVVTDSEWRIVAPQVFLTSLFSPEECENILQSIEQQGPTADARYDQPNSMQDYGVVLHDEALSKWAGDLVYTRINKEVAQLFNVLPHHEFSGHHAFMTVYGEDQNSDLSLHVDASHITLNICLFNDALRPPRRTISRMTKPNTKLTY